MSNRLFSYSVILKGDPKATEIWDHAPIEHQHSDLKRMNWSHSRAALKDSLHHMQIKASPQELNIDNHHHLSAFPEILTSLSHTRGAGAALVALSTPHLFGVGIDIEKKDRHLKESLKSKFSHQSDEYDNLLHLWMAKEAAFKASSFYWKHSKTFILKDIIVKNKTFYVENLLKGDLKICEYGDFYLAMAFVTVIQQR